MKLNRTLSLLATAAMLSWAGFVAPLAAQDAPAPAAAPAAAPAEPAPAAAAPAEAAKEAAPAAPAAEAAPAAPTGPTPTLDQRVGILEAYLTNSDPSVPLKTAKDKDGNPTIPDGLLANSPTAASSGPGHNAWMMASAALVLFMDPARPWRSSTAASSARRTCSRSVPNASAAPVW
ncbi:MAG: hypothetical protein WDN28_28715 [Chthoniobacter sp.]